MSQVEHFVEYYAPIVIQNQVGRLMGPTLINEREKEIFDLVLAKELEL